MSKEQSAAVLPTSCSSRSSGGGSVIHAVNATVLNARRCIINESQLCAWNTGLARLTLAISQKQNMLALSGKGFKYTLLIKFATLVGSWRVIFSSTANIQVYNII
jgi:hypothetical protein